MIFADNGEQSRDQPK